MAIKTEMLRCFATVAGSGNLADAAEKLGRTPSAVSMMLKQFEDHLGSPLFESERKSRLTTLGRFVLDQAHLELDHFDRTISMIEAYARSKAGFIRVAAVPSVGAAILPQVLRRFSEAHPAVRVDVRDMDSGSVIRELEKERIEIGLASGTGAGAAIEREPLFSDAFGIICPKDHPLGQLREPIGWDRISEFPFIVNGICALIENETFRQIVDNSSLTVRNTTSLFGMVRGGVGITVLPKLALADAPPDLLFLPLADKSARRDIEILRRTHADLQPVVKIFQDFVRKVTSEVVG